MKSIQSKFLAVVIAGLLVSTAVVSMIAVTMTHELLHKDADRILNNMAQREAAYLNDVFGDIAKSAAIMETYTTAEIRTVKQLSDPEYLDAFLEKAKTMFEEVALHTDSVKGFYLRPNPKYTSPTAGFYTQVTASGKFKNIPVTDISQYPENDMVNLSRYYGPIVEEKAIWLSPYTHPNVDMLLISYGFPVYVDGELLGVLGFDMDFTVFQDRISAISVYDNGYALLTNHDGTIRYTHVDREESSKPHTKAVAPLLNGMLLELRADYKDIQKDSHPMMTQIVKAFLVVLAVAVVYTFLMTHRIVRPLKELTATAESIAKGNIGEVRPVQTNSTEEINILSDVLWSAYEKIQEYTIYINALAYKDSLTGIKNSTAYTEAISRINQEINCANPKFGVLVADINNLKQTNDRFGHDMGNNLIVQAAKILTENFKDSAVFRIGGDEFAVILSGNDYENSHGALLALDEACAKVQITTKDCVVPISLARGLALYDPTIDTVYEDVFTKADQAMYLHKEACKASV